MKHSRPLILLVLAALLPLVALSAMLGAAWLRQQQAEMDRGALERVQRISAQLERELLAQVDLLRVVAQSPSLDGRLDESAFRDTAERTQREIPLWRFISLSDPAGNRLIDAPASRSGSRGKVVDVASHARAVGTRSPAIGTVLRGPLNIPAFAIRVPVIRGDRLVHILSAVVAPDAISRLLLAGGLPEGWRASVIDAEGRLVARTFGDPAFIGQTATEHALAARSRGGEGLYDSVSLEGERLMVAYRMLPGLNWSVHVAIPREVYGLPLQRSIWLLTAGALASAALVGALLWLLAREAAARKREEAAMEEVRRMEALGRMTGGVAHDFNNLLMIAQGSAEAIKRRPSDHGRVATYADAILAAVQRGEALTRQLLAFARRSPQEPVSFLLQERADELLTLLTRSTRGDIATTLTLPEGIWPVFADPNALEVALVNLAVNARDAMPGGGTLAITASNMTLTVRRDHATGLTGDYVAISVRDTGTGIPETDLERIFEPFYTTKAAGKGTGLGLSQVMGFAKQSGGAVTVDSRVGAGTTITLYLPRATREPARTRCRPALAEGAEQGHILLVEDNAEVARATEGMLTAAGCSVVWAPNGATALELIDSERFDAVLSDIVMDGGLSGLELASRLRERWPELPVVLMTGFSEALAAGIPEGLPVLTKPFGQADLLAALGAAREDAGRAALRLP